jgi:Tol biopolymer transport system component
MGVVYLGHDARLDRKVAIKALPEHLAGDPDRLARFEREAKTLASFSHPGIAGIHGVEEADGQRYLVLEYVDGETLEARLGRGALPVDDALDIGGRIAEALEAAHEKGVIHRDLKPGNIMVTPEGAVKVLDFGLARAVDAQTPGGLATGAPTQTSPVPLPSPTIPGAIMGTAGYMSPEQARGKPVDRRTDIFSFGCVLYEMLTGVRPFQGETTSDVIGALLHTDADLSRLPPGTPPSARHVLDRCLQRDKSARYRDIGDARLDLQNRAWLPQAGAAAGPAGPSRRSAVARAGWIVAAAAVTALLGVVLAPRATPRPGLGTIRFEIPPPDDELFSFGSLAVSPDGRRVAFVTGSSDETRRLWIRALDGGTARPITGTGGARYPFFSPDGRRVGFFAKAELKTVDLDTGRSIRICATGTDYGGATWNTRGDIVFASPERQGLWRVADTGGDPAQVTTLVKGDFAHVWPRFLPDGQHFLFLALGEESRHEVGSLEGQTATLRRFRGTHSETSPMDYADPGFVLFRDRHALVAQPFDAATRTLSGQPVQIAEGLSGDGPGRSFYAVSSAGTLAYGVADGFGNARLTWFDRSGKALGTVGDEAPHTAIALSPDGRRVASVLDRRPRADKAIVVYDTGDGSALELAIGDVDTPVWSPTATALAYAAARTSPPNAYVREDGSDVERPVFPSSLEYYPSDWTRNGTLVFTLWTGDVPSVNVIPVDGGQAPVRFSAEASRERFGQVSPDGRWIAAVADVSGQRRIVITSFPTAGPRWTLPGTPAVSPNLWALPWFEWSGDGRALIFIDAAGDLVSVPVASGAGVTFGAAQRLFRLPQGARDFAGSPDGRRFLVAVPSNVPKPEPLRVVVNWWPEASASGGSR